MGIGMDNLANATVAVVKPFSHGSMSLDDRDGTSVSTNTSCYSSQ